MTLAPVKTPAEIARRFGCSEAQARDQLRANAAALRRMEAKARATGKRNGGYTADELAERAGRIEAVAGA